jgi:N-acetyl-gamma-glutamyl-phosphate reductase
MDLVEILKDHPCADVVFATSNTYAGERVPGTALTYTPHDDASMSDVDAVFLALPHGASATRAKQGLDAGRRVVDLSADMRLDNAALYQKTYGLEHPHPELLSTPYGLPEITREKLRDVEAVAVPGCYPTTTLLGLYPLLARRVLAQGRPIIVDAKSGVSGAGREPKANTHFVEVFGNLSPYKVGRSHRHVVEIEQEMHKIDSNVSPLIFTPHLLPVDRGLMASIYVELDGMAADEAQALYEVCYANEPLVDVLPSGELATLKHVVRTNKCVVSLTPVLEHYLHITSVTDNLRKGAAGQAVQCFNLMCGFEETMGLL